jgi:hypothetical protein
MVWFVNLPLILPLFHRKYSCLELVPNRLRHPCSLRHGGLLMEKATCMMVGWCEFSCHAGQDAL